MTGADILKDLESDEEEKKISNDDLNNMENAVIYKTQPSKIKKAILKIETEISSSEGEPSDVEIEIAGNDTKDDEGDDRYV